MRPAHGFGRGFGRGLWVWACVVQFWVWAWVMDLGAGHGPAGTRQVVCGACHSTIPPYRYRRIGNGVPSGCFSKVDAPWGWGSLTRAFPMARVQILVPHTHMFPKSKHRVNEGKIPVSRLRGPGVEPPVSHYADQVAHATARGGGLSGGKPAAHTVRSLCEFRCPSQNYRYGLPKYRYLPLAPPVFL